MSVPRAVIVLPEFHAAGGGGVVLRVREGCWDTCIRQHLETGVKSCLGGSVVSKVTPAALLNMPGCHPTPRWPSLTLLFVLREGGGEAVKAWGVGWRGAAVAEVAGKGLAGPCWSH